MFQLESKDAREERMLRDTFGEEMVRLGRSDPRVVVLDADILNASGFMSFSREFPERTFNCGIQEADMAGIAGGLSEAGAIPFLHTFSAFAGRKIVDQVFMGSLYAGLNIKICGSDPGITSTINGGTHAGLEDMGIYMNYRDMLLLEPTDATMMIDLLPKVRDHYGVAYMRIHRKEKRRLYCPGSTFTIGKGNLLREGTDVSLIASGIEVFEALEAAELLESRGISARVVDMFTWNPIDRDLICDCAQKTGAIVTCENHYVVHGLGAAVAKVTAELCPVPMRFIGAQHYGEVGTLEFLIRKFEMSAADIAARAAELVEHKKA